MRESVSTLPVGTAREGEGNGVPTPAVITLYWDDTNACMAALDSPKTARSVSGGGLVGYLPDPYVTHPPGRMICIGE